MKKTITALLFLLFTLSGCLEIDSQEITMRYDEAADRIDIHVVYRGLYAETGQGTEEDHMKKALGDLAEVKKTGEFVFWSNWPVSLDLTVERPAPIAAVLAHIDVENGALFTDPQGLLCGQQFLRIRNAKAFAQKLNTALDVWVQTQLLGGTSGRGGKHTWDAETKDLVREFAKSGEKLLVLEPGRIEMRLPLSAKDHTWFRGQLEQQFLDHMPFELLRRIGVKQARENGDPMATSMRVKDVSVPGEVLEKEVQRAASFRFFWDNEIACVRELELTRLSFGVRGQKELPIRKASDGLYHPALLDRLRKDGEKIEDGVPDQELLRRFEAFCKRDAVLPEKLAALRAGGGKGAAGEAKKDAAGGK